MTDHVNWMDLAASAEVDPLELKKRLDLVAVCAELGILLEEQADGKWLGLCPFHDDHRPSFDVYETDDGFQRCGCFACDFGPSNDVYDLLRGLRSYGFGQALHEAQQLAVTTRASDVRERRTPVRADVDLSSLVAAARLRVRDDPSPVRSLLSDRRIPVPADWVTEQFGLGITPDGGVVIPHYSPDGTVTGAKTRRPNFTEERPWCPTAVGGSKLGQLYGAWRDQGREHVVIVEGESDTWTLAYLLRNQNDFEVFGLPSGAAARPRREWLEHLADRRVTLLFDADDGGRTALRNWVAGLSVCYVAQLREGLDVTTEKPDRVMQALAGALPYGLAPAPGLVEAPYGGHLVKAGDDQQTMVCDFIPRLLETIELPGSVGRVFRVAMPRGETVDLASSEFATDRTLRKWANRHGYTWQGGTRETQELFRMLGNEAVFHPRVIGAQTAGWSEDRSAFVLPEPHGVLGSRSYTYVPPETVRNLHELVHLEGGPWDPQLPSTLAALHRPEVTTPILGWVAASFLRPYVQAFPILAVTGLAGTGKSTLLRETLRTFGLRIALTLTSTTPMAVTGFASSTNALPVWFDEYRRGARTDARLAFEQVLRDAWESQKSYKGGFGDQRQEIHSLAASAPIVVTGEDAFQETSHLERMALINLPSEGRDADALARLYTLERAGFGRVFLEWLFDALETDTLTDPPHVHDRPAHARAVVAWGYEVFATFARSVCGVELPAFDASLLERSHDPNVNGVPLVELILACEGRYSGGSAVAVRDGADMLVKVHDLVQQAKALDIPIAGGARALKNELEQRYETRPFRDMSGTYLRLVGFDG